MTNIYVGLPILFVLIGSSYAQWTYTTVANTTDGRPCLTDCIDGQCIVDWLDNRLPCITKDVNYIAPKYRTAEVKDKGNRYCLSNCGYFGYEFEWCITSNDKKWDYCNSSDDHMSPYKHKCKEHCDKHGENYYWCYVEGGSWQHCAPPREKQHRRLRQRK